MPKKEDNKTHIVARKSWGAQIDTKLADELKHLSVDLNTPLYLLAEEAFRMLIASKKKLLSKKNKRKKPFSFVS